MTRPASTSRTGGAGPADWRLEIPTARRRHLAVWFLSGAALTLVILIIGGITRLTQSGLSIVDWAPIMGAIPPLNEAQWQEAFDAYRQSPEYLELRRGMTMEEFRFIFFWEYLHRMAARLIGLVFLIPFLFFWIRGYLSRPLMRRALLLFALGAMQGVMGWLMVRSGLVDVPRVSHYRLAAHLGLAFLIFGACLWFALDLRPRPVGGTSRRSRGRVRTSLYVVGGLLAVQVFWGALVAGLKAGLYFNTFPLMGGRLIPPNAFGLEPLLINFLENPFTVQWMHRMLGTVLGFGTLALFLMVRKVEDDRPSRKLNLTFSLLILIQYLLGVLTLLFLVPITLGVAHQALALVIFGVWVAWVHRLHWLESAGRGVPRSAAPRAEGPGRL